MRQPGEQREAGRVLDAEIAERVCSWVWTPWRDEWHRPDGCYDGDEWAGPARRDELVLRDGRFGPAGPPGPYCSPPPRYSTDIAAAFQVVEAMIAAGWRIYIDGPKNGDEEWRAMFAQDRVSESAGANALPLAICLASLAAIFAASSGQSAVENPSAPVSP